ncbi:MAG: cytidylate kinase family protein, partial [Lachnospiraceae bacterium]|nr:cytidylate kinase family protein [Lachnospiraceae bacterium]
MDSLKSIAIEREFGSGGRDLGIRIAQKTGIPYYDSEILMKTAKEYGIEIDTL